MSTRRHYRIHSTAPREHAGRYRRGLEALHTAYERCSRSAEATSKFAVVLYGSRAEFSRHNRSSPWAEAFYLDPTCYAYFEVGARNPTTGRCTKQCTSSRGRAPASAQPLDRGRAGQLLLSSQRVGGRLQPWHDRSNRLPGMVAH